MSDQRRAMEATMEKPVSSAKSQERTATAHFALWRDFGDKEHDPT
jgi:hypothetical protein